MNPNYVKTQIAGAAGQLDGIKGLENFGEEPKEDTNNWQPRIGFAYDLRGDGKDVIRGGWGVYQDVGYTNSNVLFPAIDATGIGSGVVFNVDNPAGIRNAGRQLLSGRPADLEHRQPEPGEPQLAAAHRPVPRSAPADAVHAADGVRLVARADDQHGGHGRLRAQRRSRSQHASASEHRPVGQPAAPRRLAFLDLQPNAAGTRAAISGAESKYTGLIFGFKRRMYNGFDFTATYTLADAKSKIGTAADELNSNNLQDATLLFDDPKIYGPTSRTDARHSGTIAAIIQAPWGITVSPLFIFRSALPVSIIEGLDLNLNGELNDIPATAYAFDGVGNAPKDLGTCETWNCGRGAKRTQFNLRVSKAFHLFGSSRIEAIAEVFNLFNAKNPDGFLNPDRRLLGDGTANPNFLQPTEYAGDFQNGEQRLAQFGFRFSF